MQQMHFTEEHVSEFHVREFEPIDIGYMMTNSGYVGMFEHNDRNDVSMIYIVIDDNELAYEKHCEEQMRELDNAEPTCTNPAMHDKFADRGIEDQCPHCIMKHNPERIGGEL